MGSKVVKIFGMFDRLDDIIYEPLKLVCDVLRQPLKQIDAYNERKKQENQQVLKQQADEFEVNLELERKRREMQLNAEERKIQLEVERMAQESDLAQREEMVQLEMRYRKEMADAAVQLASVLANMQVETRGKILDLYRQKEVEYLDLQAKYKKDMLDTVKCLKETFPDGTGDDIIKNEVTSQLKIITERSQEFSKLMRQDMEKVFGIIDDGMKEVTGLATKYFQPAEQNQKALTQHVVEQIEV